MPYSSEFFGIDSWNLHELPPGDKKIVHSFQYQGFCSKKSSSKMLYNLPFFMSRFFVNPSKIQQILSTNPEIERGAVVHKKSQTLDWSFFHAAYAASIFHYMLCITKRKFFHYLLSRPTLSNSRQGANCSQISIEVLMDSDFCQHNTCCKIKAKALLTPLTSLTLLLPIPFPFRSVTSTTLRPRVGKTGL